ncbi:MAG TPA: zf-HC2 domain-containing protein [Gemmatimonadales bacterium]|nr:zf-HC2 domain-containing protein [Gemmatimonadales bacterium]
MSHVAEGTLHSYLDGELSVSERAAVDAHLAQCGTCRATLAEERALLERATTLLGAARPVERPAPPIEQLGRRPRVGRSRIRVSLAWAASILLALGIGYYLRQPKLPPVSQLADRTPASVSNQPAARELSAPPPPPRTGAPAPERRLARREKPSDRRAADELAARQRIDSETNVARALRSEADVEVKTAPAPALAAQRVYTPAASIGAVPAGRLATTAWPIIDRRAAASFLGTDPVGLPGLTVRSIRRSPAGNGEVVVEQALDSTTAIQIFQWQAGPTLSDSAGAGFIARARVAERQDRMLARFVGKLRVEIGGAVSADSLNRLLEQVRPLPLPSQP